MRPYEFGRFRLDPERLLLYHADVPVALGPKVVQTLLVLLEHPGEIHSKRAMVARIWPEGYVDEANLVQNIYILRKLLRAHGYDGAIETVPRRGYRFALTVRSAESEARAENARPRWYRALAAATIAAGLLVVGSSTYVRSREAHGTSPSVESRLYTIGSFFLDRRTAYAVRRSIVIFARAIAYEPRDARAYAARAAAYAVAADNGFGSAATDRNRARRDALTALAFDARCGEAYAALGLLAIDADRYDDARKDLRAAIDFAPASADAHAWYGIALLARADIARARKQLQIAERLDPLSIVATAWLSSVSYFDRRYADAVAYAREGLGMAPQRTSLLITLGLAQEAEGAYPDALRSFERYGRSCGRCRSEAAALLAGVYAQLHHPVQAQAELAIAKVDLRAVRPQDLLLAAAAAGEGRTLALPVPMTPTERMLIANDPRFDRLSSAERQRLLNQG